MTETFPAEKASLNDAMDFITAGLEQAGASMKTVMEVQLAFEEIFVNIASYAYGEEGGTAEVSYETDGGCAVIGLSDSGSPFDPFGRPDPDVFAKASDRSIGGLGIFMAKKLMDECLYEYSDGHNKVTMKKKIGG